MVLDPPDSKLESSPIALWVSPVSDLGGVARHFTDVAKVGIPGFKLVFLVPRGTLADLLAKSGAEVNVAEFGPLAGFWRSRKALNSALRDLQPAVIHSHLAYADIVLAATPVIKGSIRVSTEHGISAPNIYHGSQLRSRIMRLVHKMRSRRFAALIAVSESTKDVMARLWKPKTDISVIYNGVDAPAISPKALRRANGVINILSLARLSQEKRIDSLIRAFALVRKANEYVRLIIAGDGPEAASLKLLATQLGVEDSIDFVGFVEPNAALDRANVLVQLSKWENCSYTLLDAKVRGLSVLATSVGGNPEILDSDSLVTNLDVVPLAETILKKCTEVDESHDDRAWPSVAQMTTKISSVYRETLMQ